MKEGNSKTPEGMKNMRSSTTWEECRRRKGSNGRNTRKVECIGGDRSGSESLSNQEQDREDGGKERKGNTR